MLGFSPLASAPLGGDVFLGEVVPFLVGISIVTNPPTIPQPTVTSNIPLLSTPITLGLPILGTGTLAGIQNLLPRSILTAEPELLNPVLSGVQGLESEGFVAELPTLGLPTVTLVLPLLAEDIVTGAVSIDTSELVNIQGFFLQEILSGNSTVGTITLLQEHNLAPFNIVSDVSVLDDPIAFSQGPFDPNYNKQRVAFIVSENRSVIVPFTPRKVIQEVKLQNRTTRI